MNDFTTVFLFTTNTESLINPILGISAIVIGISVLGYHLYTGIESSLRLRMLKAFITLLCIYVFMFLIVSNIERKTTCRQICASEERCQRLIEIYNNRQYEIVEGTVHVLYQSVGSRDGGDIIDVGGKRLNIRNYVATCGYTDVIVQGGVLKEGEYARIYYIEDKTFDSYDKIYYVIFRIDLRNENKNSYSPELISFR
jgi:hypothetical protein